MTWLAQVRHIAWKDVREWRWMLSVYVVTVIAATARAIALPFAPDLAGTALMLLVVVMGIVASATLVQSDSPTRTKAFWATRPFSRTAVASAKMLLVILALMVLPLVGQSVALARFDVTAGELPGLLFQSAVIYGMWLLAALLIGAFTSDLRTFILTFMAVIVGITIAQTLMSSAVLGNSTTLTRSVIVISTAALGIWLLIDVYRTRLRTSRSWVAAALVVAGVLWFAFSGIAAPAIAPETVSATGLQFSIALEDSGRVTRERLDLRLGIEGAPPGEAITFIPDSAILRLRSGAVLRARGMIGTTVFRAPDVILTPSVRWLGSHDFHFASRGISVNLEPRDVHAIASDLATVELTGRVVPLEPRIVGRLPIRSGASLTRDGMQVRVGFVDHRGDEIIIQLQTAEVLRRHSPATQPLELGVSQLPTYALQNTNRNEAVLLYSRGSSGGPEWLVLPGSSLIANASTLGSEVGRRASQGVQLDDAWYRDAQLLIVRWEPTANYPVRAIAARP